MLVSVGIMLSIIPVTFGVAVGSAGGCTDLVSRFYCCVCDCFMSVGLCVLSFLLIPSNSNHCSLSERRASCVWIPQERSVQVLLGRLVVACDCFMLLASSAVGRRFRTVKCRCSAE